MGRRFNDLARCLGEGPSGFRGRELRFTAQHLVDASPAMTGMARMRDPIRHQRPGLPKAANTRIATTMTISRKLVPQRG